VYIKLLKRILKSIVTFFNKLFSKKRKSNSSRILIQTLSSNLISVQPMSRPSGILNIPLFQEREDIFRRVILIEKYKTFSLQHQDNHVSFTAYLI